MPNGYGPRCASDDSDGYDGYRPPTPPTPIDSPALWGATRNANPPVAAAPLSPSSDEVMPGAAALFEEHRVRIPGSAAAAHVNPFRGGLHGNTLHINSAAPIGPGGPPMTAGHAQAEPKTNVPKPSRAPSAPGYKTPRQTAPQHRHVRKQAPKHSRSGIGPLPPPWGPRNMESVTCDIARAHDKNMRFAQKTMSFVHGRRGASRGRHCRICARFLMLDF